MNRIYALWITLTCGSLVGNATESVAGESNLLTNSGFEECSVADVADQKVLRWQINTWAYPGTVELIADEEHTYSGGQCLLLRPKNTGRAEAHVFQSAPVDSGQKYIFRIWVRSDGGGRTKLIVYQYDKQKFIGSVGTDYLRISDKWTEFTYEYDPGNRVVDSVGCAVAAIDGPVYLDDASFGTKAVAE